MKPDSKAIHAQRPCLGVLLANLGTPDAPTPQALRRYLAQFLSDPRVIELPRALWKPILHGIVLRTRPKRSATAYAKIWTSEGSPLLVITRRQAARLQAALDTAVPGPVAVEAAMRYGAPSIGEAMEKLRAAGARRLLVIPLYPQYSATTTASTLDAVGAQLRRWRWQPEIRTINGYHDDHGYIEALAGRVRAHWEEHGRGERLILSFHGIPRRYFLAGDPYHCFCHKTARLLAQALRLDEDEWQVTFQSRFGKAPWLRPYTDATLKGLARSGVRNVDIICPGFAADCLETLEEIAKQNREWFIEAGGSELRYIPALNDDEAHIGAMATLVHRHIQGWEEADPSWSEAAVTARIETAQARAAKLGAR